MKTIIKKLKNGSEIYHFQNDYKPQTTEELYDSLFMLIFYFNEKGELHRDNGPAITALFQNKEDKYQVFYQNGHLFLENAPAIIHSNHNKTYHSYFERKINNFLDKDKILKNLNSFFKRNGDGHSFIHFDYYFFSDFMYRKNDLPSHIVYKDKEVLREDYTDGKGEYHRLHGPARISYYLDKKASILEIMYYLHGRLHRDDGPAIVEYNQEGLVQRERFFIENELVLENFY